MFAVAVVLVAVFVVEGWMLQRLVVTVQALTVAGHFGCQAVEQFVVLPLDQDSVRKKRILSEGCK